MERNTLIALVIGLVVGAVGGYAAARYFGDDPAPAATASAPVAVAPSLGGGMGGGMGSSGPLPTPAGLPSPEVQARISRAEAAVLANPKDHAAWVSLGNDYFDTHQAQKSVDAYGKALALKPDDPDILTDQGVMYRELGQFEKALANFQRANKVQPQHVQSLFNVGVVYSSDLHKPDEAAKAWKKLIAQAPSSDQAAQAREFLKNAKK